MKGKRNILITIILFTAALFCFEANTHVHFNTPQFNVENSTDSTTGEEKCSSSSEPFDDFKINSNIDLSNLEGAQYDVPQCSALFSSYIISFWQPPKIS